MQPKRSSPGKGDIIGIYVMGPADLAIDGQIGGYGHTAMCASVGEDYSDSSWPIVVKVKPDVEQKQLIRRLRDLADAVENGFFVEAVESNVGKRFLTPKLLSYDRE